MDEGEEHLDDLELGKVFFSLLKKSLSAPLKVDLSQVRALFPTMASMSHSCFANVRMLHRPGYRMLFRTLRKVT